MSWNKSVNTGKADNYEKGLKKGEGRIAWLQKQLEIGPHAAFYLETPTSSGISEKNYIKIIQEYLKLQKTLNHIQLTGLTRDEIALNNREMYEMLIKLQEENDQLKRQIDELWSTTNSNDNQLVTEIKELLLEKKTYGKNGIQATVCRKISKGK